MEVVTAAMVATRMLITVVTAMEVMVTVVITGMVIGMPTGTGTVATGTEAVTAIGGMVAGGAMVSAPVGDWYPVAGSGFATDRPSAE
jgi:hypothetical protein